MLLTGFLLLTFSATFFILIFLSGLGPSTSMSNQENASETYPQAYLKEAIGQLGFHLFRQVPVKLRQTTTDLKCLVPNTSPVQLCKSVEALLSQSPNMCGNDRPNYEKSRVNGTSQNKPGTVEDMKLKETRNSSESFSWNAINSQPQHQYLCCNQITL